MRPIEQASYWLADRPPRAADRLSGDTRTDLAIIGGGFTGLWTAIRLKQLAPDADVVVVEQSVLGSGGSGRNAGHVSGTIDHSYTKAIAHFGQEEARRMAQVGLENLAAFEGFLRDHAIECGYARTGQLLVALNDAQLAEARAGIAVATEVGVAGHRLLNTAETRAELDSPLYRGSAFDPAWGIIHPVKLIEGLRRVAEQQGVRLYEQSPVTAIKTSRKGIAVTVAGGRLQTDRLVLATNAYSHQLFPRLGWRFIPLYDYIIVSEPLTDAQRARIGWRQRQAVIDGRNFFNYYRLTDDQRILWGSSEAMYYPPNRVDSACDHSGRHYAQLQESFRLHFPQLTGLQFPFAWGGPIGSTTRLTPFFGKTAGGRISYGLGYTGLGIANSHLAGQILAHLALGKPSPLLDLALVRQSPLPFPPEPVRRLAVHLVTGALRQVDAGRRPNWLLRTLDRLGIGFSS